MAPRARAEQFRFTNVQPVDVLNTLDGWIRYREDPELKAYCTKYIEHHGKLSTKCSAGELDSIVYDFRTVLPKMSVNALLRILNMLCQAAKTHHLSNPKPPLSEELESAFRLAMSAPPSTPKGRRIAAARELGDLEDQQLDSSGTDLSPTRSSPSYTPFETLESLARSRMLCPPHRYLPVVGVITDGVLGLCSKCGDVIERQLPSRLATLHDTAAGTPQR